MITANSLNTAIYPNTGSQIFVSQVSGNDANTGSYFSPLATFGAAIALHDGTYPNAQIIGLDSAVYDESLAIGSNIYIYAPIAVLFCSTADAIVCTGSGVNVTFATIQSTGGNAITVNGGYPVFNFLASFAGNIVCNTGAGIVTINANGFFGNISNPGSGTGTKTVLNCIFPPASVDAFCFAPWSNTLIPFT